MRVLSRILADTTTLVNIGSREVGKHSRGVIVLRDTLRSIDGLVRVYPLALKTFLWIVFLWPEQCPWTPENRAPFTYSESLAWGKL